MKRWLVAAALAYAASAQVAAAADLPIGPPVYRPQQVVLFTWSGFYVGAHGGGAWVHKEETGVPFAALGNAVVPNSVNLTGSGWLLGGQLGVNYQTGMWVIGGEAQGSFAQLNGDSACSSTATAGVVVNIINATCSAKVDALATFALRLGVAVDRLLVYGKIGGALANDKYASFGGNVLLTQTFNANETRWGWMAGVGVEYAFTDKWSVKLEYNHLDLGTRSVRFADDASTVSYLVDIRQTVDLVKVGVNYRFGVSSLVVSY
ncbi:MAG: porin family protein [Hyphomicrobiales bacterium]|nr:porin family protein [Hyphomicrobiales bacterium]